MSAENQDRPALDLETLLEDKALLRLRQAHHELEAFQLSDRHQQAKKELQERLRNFTEG